MCGTDCEEHLSMDVFEIAQELKKMQYTVLYEVVTGIRASGLEKCSIIYPRGS